jgi:hypothetical protein
MKRLLFPAALLIFLLAGCGQLPKTHIKFTEMEGASARPAKPASEISLDKIELFEGLYPYNITREEDLIKVMKEEGLYREDLVQEGDLYKIANMAVLKKYGDRIALLGKGEVSLEQGEGTSPLIWIKTNIYVNNKDTSGLVRYCQSMNWQNYAPVYPFLFTLPNFLGPWNYPCWFLEDHSSRTKEDIQYRMDTLKYEMRDLARQKGGNAVIGFQAGSKKVHIDSILQSGMSDSPAWNASGFIAWIEQ